MVAFKHVQDCLPEQRKVVLGEPGRLAGEVCRNIAFRAVEPVGDNILSANLGALFSASASVVIAVRVIVNSCGTMGSMLRAKDSCTGPRTCPQLSAPLTQVVSTAPKVRMSKNSPQR